MYVTFRTRSTNLVLGVEAKQAGVFFDEARCFAEVEKTNQEKELAQSKLSQRFVISYKHQIANSDRVKMGIIKQAKCVYLVCSNVALLGGRTRRVCRDFPAIDAR